jgi:hypothetical protein
MSLCTLCEGRPYYPFVTVMHDTTEISLRSRSSKRCPNCEGTGANPGSQAYEGAMAVRAWKRDLRQRRA